MNAYILMDFQHDFYGYVRLCKNKVEKLISAIEKITQINEEIDFCDYGALSFDGLGDEDGNVVVGEVGVGNFSEVEKRIILRVIKYGYSIFFSNEPDIEDLITKISESPAPMQLKTKMILVDNSVKWSFGGLGVEEKVSVGVLLPALKTLLTKFNDPEE